MSRHLSSNEVYVDINELEKTSAKFENEAKIFAENIKKLKNCIDEMSLYWQGEAADVFTKSIKSDILVLLDMRDLYNITSNDYRNAIDEYKSNEQKIFEILNVIEH